jgi:hypothetical protein
MMRKIFRPFVVQCAKRVATGAAVLVALGAFLAPTPVLAHHSVSAEFDTNKPIEFTGTVKTVEWTNPHIYTQVETKGPDGKTVVYRVEGGAPNSLFRSGWRKDTLKVGETVTVKGVRAKREESMNIGNATITTSDGRRMFGGGTAQREATQQQQ